MLLYLEQPNRNHCHSISFGDLHFGDIRENEEVSTHK